MAFALKQLSSKSEVDSAIKNTLDKVLVLRFGRASDAGCMQLDHVVRFFAIVCHELGSLWVEVCLQNALHDLNGNFSHLYRLQGQMLVSPPPPPPDFPNLQTS